MVLLQRKLYFSKDPEGVQHFPVGGGGGGGAPASSRGEGVQIFISIEPYNLWFPCVCVCGGVPTPYPHYGSAHKHEAVILIETGVWKSG